MTQALVLDFGGVISRTLFETHDTTERALGLPAGTLTWRGPFDPASDALWREMQADRDKRGRQAGEFGQCFVCEEELDAELLSVDPTITRCANCVET